ncbi:hypothetical protein FOMPIDRAFT_94769 [Fomitopsis schrenkii]|uniref:Uncharacterized protein n=1 Tax=Fomitopsis schrenkii TaxID=2126942 RepID=S8DMA6_FOMSC|nr:hypothetical protein FOMPIDRAFT_94769 [Fomitopsis schrenkii]
MESCRRIFLADSMSTERSDKALQERLNSDVGVVRIRHQAHTAQRRLDFLKSRLKTLTRVSFNNW